MDYLKYNNKGFSLVEVIIVVAILTLLLSISDSIYSNVRASTNLKIAGDSIVQALRSTKTNASIGKNDSKWGVKTLVNKIVIFKGVDYTSRDIAYDQIINLPNGVVASGLDEFIFEKVTGNTINTGDIIITNSSGSKNIGINGKGNITY